MNKIIYDYYVYMTICEVTMDLHKRSRFPSYLGYCNTVKTYLLDSNSKIDNSFIHMSEIVDRLEKLFSMDLKTIGEYIFDFFIDEQYKKFEKPVHAMKVFDFNQKLIDRLCKVNH